MIVFDTHVLVWWIGQPNRLTLRAKRSIQQTTEKKEILVSSISIWEIYLLVKRGRLQLNMDVDSWIGKVEGISLLRFIPVDNRIASKSVTLPDPLHSDPADRMIIATALTAGATLITADKRILKYPLVQSLW